MEKEYNKNPEKFLPANLVQKGSV